MMMNSDLFFKSLSNHSELPDLYYFDIILEYAYPILFICQSEAGTLYIVSCFLVDGEKQQFVVSETTNQALLDMLHDKITMHDIFCQGKDLFVITKAPYGTNVTCEKFTLETINQTFLPSPGFFIEADEGEFDDIIDKLTAESGNSQYEVSTSTVTFAANRSYASMTDQGASLFTTLEISPSVSTYSTFSVLNSAA